MVAVPSPSYPIHIYGPVIAGANVRGIPVHSTDDFLAELEQSVPLMYRLLGAISKLEPAKEDDSLTIQITRPKIRLLGRLYFQLTEPYTNTSLSLHAQLVHLS